MMDGLPVILWEPPATQWTIERASYLISGSARKLLTVTVTNGADSAWIDVPEGVAFLEPPP